MTSKAHATSAHQRDCERLWSNSRANGGITLRRLLDLASEDNPRAYERAHVAFLVRCALTPASQNDEIRSMVFGMLEERFDCYQGLKDSEHTQRQGAAWRLGDLQGRHPGRLDQAQH